MAVDRAFWQAKRVFLTGHTGFKGGWLSLWLKDMGAVVSGYALAPATVPSFFETAGVANAATHTIGDLRAPDALTAAMRAARPDVVFHLGAQSLVRASYDDPVGTFATNVMGTANVLDAVLQLNREAASPSPIRAVVVVTSDKCYRNNEDLRGYREDDPLGGRDPYSSSKAAAELVTAAYRSSFAPEGRPVAIASARAGNVVGGGDWAPDRLVPDAVRAMAAGKTLMIRSPTAIRPWQHVLEPLAGYLLLAQRLVDQGAAFAEAWNFGPDAASERPVADVVGILARSWGIEWKIDHAPQPHEAHYLKLDSSKARSRLGWTPRLTLEDALTLTGEWYLAHQRGKGSLRDLTLSQIRSYAGG